MGGLGLGSRTPDRENARMKKDKAAPETRLIHTRAERLGRVTVNPPVERASTLLFRDEAGLYGAKPTYGRMGLTVHRELEAAMCELEGARYTRLAGNGLQACALAIASVLTSGDHLLFTDSAYGPTARFCERRLKAMGVEAERFDPRSGGDLRNHRYTRHRCRRLETGHPDDPGQHLGRRPPAPAFGARRGHLRSGAD